MNPGIDHVFIISLNNEYAYYDVNVYYIYNNVKIIMYVCTNMNISIMK